jgi:hypothetical protein
MLSGLQQMMMVVPVDAQVDEAQNITEKYRNQWLQSRKPSSMRGLHFQHHDRDDDGKYTVTESLHASLAHHVISLLGLLYPEAACLFPQRIS